MSAGVLPDEQLLLQVRELRALGKSPEQIARTLGVRPARISPLIRKIAAADASTTVESGVFGCWVNAGWSAALIVKWHADWPGRDEGSSDCGGLIGVVIAREHRACTVSVCGYLVDVYCLGVKNALGPRAISSADVNAYVKRFYAGFERAAVQVPVELARHIVFGTIGYARTLGFQPALSFHPAADHLGGWDGVSDIQFGRNGKPLYIAGPYDDFGQITHTLETRVGVDNFDFSVPVLA